MRLSNRNGQAAQKREDYRPLLNLSNQNLIEDVALLNFLAVALKLRPSLKASLRACLSVSLKVLWCFIGLSSAILRTVVLEYPVSFAISAQVIPCANIFFSLTFSSSVSLTNFLDERFL